MNDLTEVIKDALAQHKQGIINEVELILIDEFKKNEPPQNTLLNILEALHKL